MKLLAALASALLITVGFAGVSAVAQADMICTMDVKMCPDGSYVSRDGARDCAFAPCPNEQANPKPLPVRRIAPPPRMCALDVRVCPNGSTVVRNPALKCAFNACPKRPVRPNRTQHPNRPTRPHR
jgi:hypothetical protein